MSPIFLQLSSVMSTSNSFILGPGALRVQILLRCIIVISVISILIIIVQFFDHLLYASYSSMHFTYIN